MSTRRRDEVDVELLAPLLPAAPRRPRPRSTTPATCSSESSSSGRSAAASAASSASASARSATTASRPPAYAASSSAARCSTGPRSTRSSPRSCRRRATAAPMPGAGAGDQVAASSGGSARSCRTRHPSAIAAKPSRACSIGQRPVDHRPDAGRVQHRHQRRRARARVPIVEPITLSWRKKIRVRPASSSFGPGGRAAGDERAAGPQRPDRVQPGRLADRLHDRVDGGGQPLAGLVDLVGARARAPWRAWPRRGWWPAPGGPPARAERDQRGRDAAAGALDQHGVAGLAAALDEEHPVRRQPRGRQARGLLERQRRRLGHHVAPAARRPCRRRCPGSAPRAATGRGSRVSSPRPARAR